MPEYSVVVPVYNSEKTLEELYERLEKVFAALGRTFELLFVEDGGRDDSWQVIGSLQKKYPAIIKGIKLSKNFGQHNALICGFNHVSGQFIITLDDDLQTPPEEIPKLIATQQRETADLVYAIYANKKHHQVRNIGSYVIKRVFKIVFNAKPDASSFRLISRNLIDKIIRHNQNFVFIDGLLHWHTTNIAYQVTDHHDRKHGQSNYNLYKLIQLSSNLFFNFTVIPLRIITSVGILVSIISFLLGVYFLINKFYYNIPVQGYTSLVTIILFSTSMIMISLGVIGEYISRIYMLQNNKPQYSIEKKI
jgi:undecaprenyl-phosphate 4-deoxy-4-formamido-L-arabinose transferase